MKFKSQTRPRNIILSSHDLFHSTTIGGGWTVVWIVIYLTLPETGQQEVGSRLNRRDRSYLYTRIYVSNNTMKTERNSNKEGDLSCLVMKEKIIQNHTHKIMVSISFIRTPSVTQYSTSM